MFKKIILCLLLLSNAACQEKSQEAVIKVAVSPDYPPFEYKKDGEIVGFDIDVAKMIAEKQGKKLEILELEFASLIPALQSGKIDFVMSGLTVTPERSANVSFSDVYYEASIAGIAKDYTSNSLANKRVGAQLGSFMESFAKEQQEILSGITIISLANNLHLFQELKLGRIDILLLEEAQISEFLKHSPNLTAVSFENTEGGYAVAFKKNSLLKEEFNTALKQLKEDGSIKELENKWLKTKE